MKISDRIKRVFKGKSVKSDCLNTGSNLGLLICGQLLNGMARDNGSVDATGA